MSSTAWIMIGLIAAGTVAIKAVGPVALGGNDLPPRLGAVVARLAPSLLAALVVVDLFGGQDRSLSVDESVFGVLAAGVALVARLPMVAVVAIAAGVTAAVRALG
jgi:branched-subunit amino acid transport protein